MLDETPSNASRDRAVTMPWSLAGGWLWRHRQRLAQVGTGHLLYASFNWFFDNILYILVVYHLGLLVGGLIMTALSLLLSVATLLVYERMRIDWVGAGSLARLSEVQNPSGWQRLVLWAMGRGKVAIFIALCVFQDPFITTAYFRQGRFDGFNGRDWRIFFASVLVSNFYWTLRSGAVAAVLVGTWHWLGQ